MKIFWLIASAAFLSGCAAQKMQQGVLPSGASAYAVLGADSAGAASPSDYRIGPLDKLDVTVFQEPELSAKEIQVDASGNIALPLVGSVNARDKTARDLSKELEVLFDAHYLRDSQVTVTVASSVSQKVSIQGEVSQPGVYQLNGPTTLLDVISMAKGETELAKLQEVVVFRSVDGQRMGAVFDVASIRRGGAADPVIHGNDLVVVGYSAAKRFWRNVVSAAPLFNVFRPVGY
jgi:polysaccharide export outer membrane protein